MNAPAAMQADYCDLRFVKGRKVIQVVLELPIEAGAQFVSMFGTPDPSKTVPVALARLGAPAQSAPAEVPKERRKWDELSIAQQAGIMCNEKGFQRYISESLNKRPDEVDTDAAATYVRTLCGVNSRAHIEGNETAERKFRALRISYDNWLRVPA